MITEDKLLSLIHLLMLVSLTQKMGLNESGCIKLMFIFWMWLLDQV